MSNELFLFPSSVGDDYKVAINASTFIETFQATTTLGSPILTFIIYVDSTYFQTPQAVLVYLESNDSFPPFLLLDNQKESDVVVFSTSDDLPARIQYTRSIIYGRPAIAGEYQLSLVVSVLAREELSGVIPLRETRTSSLYITVEGISDRCLRIAKCCVKG